MADDDKVTEHTHSSVDIRTITAPILTLLSIAGMIVWATTSVWEQKEALKNDIRAEIKEYNMEWKDHKKEIEGTLNQYRELLHQIEETMMNMKYRQKFLLENMWSKRDHAIWCREMERSNEQFKCPDEDLKRSGLIGSDSYIGPIERDRKQMLKDMEIEGNKLFNKNNSFHNPDYYKKQNK